MLKLILPETTEQFEFSGDQEISIGRVEGNRLVIDNPLISARHGLITRRRGRYCFQDLNSTNGSVVQRGNRTTRLETNTADPVVLQAGDRLLLGDEANPVVLVVETCQDEADRTEPAASLPIRSITETSRRIEAGGQSLVPFLALAENLASASTAEVAEIEFHDCVRQLIPSIRDITLVACPEEGLDLSVLTVQEIEGDPGQIARIPVDLGPAVGRLALLKSGSRRYSPVELDSCALAATLLAVRLRQLNQVKQLERARTTAS